MISQRRRSTVGTSLFGVAGRSTHENDNVIERGARSAFTPRGDTGRYLVLLQPDLEGARYTESKYAARGQLGGVLGLFQAFQGRGDVPQLPVEAILIMLGQVAEGVRGVRALMCRGGFQINGGVPQPRSRRAPPALLKGTDGPASLLESGEDQALCPILRCIDRVRGRWEKALMQPRLGGAPVLAWTIQLAAERPQLLGVGSR